MDQERQREIVFYHASVKKYLTKLNKNGTKHHDELVSLIQKLNENGYQEMKRLLPRNYKILGKDFSNEPDIIQIKITTKPYRIHVICKNQYMYLVNAFDKKQNKTPTTALSTSKKRSKEIFK